jgi:hypothetical protein
MPDASHLSQNCEPKHSRTFVRRTMKIDSHVDQRLSDVAVSIASAGTRLWGAVKSAWPTTMAGRAGKYRPEAHYMRGPGPKWRAKNAHISAQSFAQR